MNKSCVEKTPYLFDGFQCISTLVWTVLMLLLV